MTVLTPHTTLATRMWPSRPGYTSAIRPNGHRPLGVSGWITRTTSPTFRSRNSEVHFGRLLRAGIHSLSHLLHTREIMSLTFRHRWRRCKGVVSTDSGANCPPIWPCKKWLGVNGTSSLISQRTGIKKGFHPSEHSDQLLIIYISFSYNDINGFLSSFHHYFMGSFKMWGTLWIESPCQSKFCCLVLKVS